MKLNTFEIDVTVCRGTCRAFEVLTVFDRRARTHRVTEPLNHSDLAELSRWRRRRVDPVLIKQPCIVIRVAHCAAEILDGPWWRSLRRHASSSVNGM